MARKAKPHEEELPFVALMDTMTNVVGVLIIVLVMIGIGLAKSVQKVLSDLPMVSVEEHKILKDEMGQYDAKRDPAEVQLEIAKLQDELKKIEDELHALEGEKS
jgi:cell division protein FtsB